MENEEYVRKVQELKEISITVCRMLGVDPFEKIESERWRVMSDETMKTQLKLVEGGQGG